MQTLAESFLSYARETLVREFWPRLCVTLDALTDEQAWWRPNPASNSIGNLLLHLNGNVQQWILCAMGGQAFDRDRDAEFQARENIPASELRGRLHQTLARVDTLLANLTPDDLAQPHTIQGHDVTGLQAIFHVVEHFAMHYGQILYIAKMLEDRDLGFYAHLSGQER